MSNEIVPFSYDGLDLKARAAVREKTSEIKSLMHKTAQNIIDIGERLADVKGQLKHGQWGDWLEAEFSWSDDTARRYMNVAKQFGQKPQIAEFDPSALYLLAATSTPEKARDEALERASAGEKITHKTALEIVAAHKKFGAILVIPRWEDDLEDDSDYPRMTPEDLAGLPIGDLAADDCALYLLASNKYLFQMFDLGEAWGFKYTGSGFNWIRLAKDFPPGGSGILNDDRNWHAGPDNGFMRMNAQMFFLFKKGHPKRLDKGVRMLLVDNARDDSSKPDELYEGIQRLSAGPYCEVFPRGKHEGWAAKEYDFEGQF